MIRHVAILTYPNVQMLDAVGPAQIFATARDKLRENQPAYRVEIIAPMAGPVRTSSGVAIVAERAFAEIDGGIDTLILTGGPGARGMARDPALREWVAGMAPKVRRLASVCTGAFILAGTGLLAGKRATTHWESAADFRRQHPQVRLDPERLWIRDGDIWTSAGVTAGMDLALAMLEADHGRDLTIKVARHLVMFAKRSGTQSQFSSLLAEQAVERGSFAELCDWMLANPAADLSVPELAARVGMSPRSFARRFLAETGETPGRFAARVRLDAARRLLEEGRPAVGTVAARTGFASPETMRLAFQRRLGAAPRDYRDRFPTAEVGTETNRGDGS